MNGPRKKTRKLTLMHSRESIFFEPRRKIHMRQ